MIDWQGQKVMIFGAGSMLSRPLHEKLKELGASIYPVYHKDWDLCDARQAEDLVAIFYPKYVFNFAGFNGGIAMNLERPAEIFHRTTMINFNVLTACSKYKVAKVIQPITSCAYPAKEGRLSEVDFLNGLPHPSVECHGYAKRNAFLYGTQLHKQYGLNVVNVVFNNCYGPHDRFDEPGRLKVAGSLIKKIVDSKKNNTIVELLGDGTPRRELLYSEDAAEAAIKVAEYYNDSTSLINVGTGVDITIKELAEKIKSIVGFTGEIAWDTSKPNGQMQKLLDISKMQRMLGGWYPKTSLNEGLLKTVNWYKENYK